MAHHQMVQALADHFHFSLNTAFVIFRKRCSGFYSMGREKKKSSSPWTATVAVSSTIVPSKGDPSVGTAVAGNPILGPQDRAQPLHWGAGMP